MTPQKTSKKAQVRRLVPNYLSKTLTGSSCLSAFVDGQPDRYITLQVPIIGLGVIVLDGLLRREWVKEDELASDLKIHPRIMRKSLRWFEQVGKWPNTLSSLGLKLQLQNAGLLPC